MKNKYSLKRKEQFSNTINKGKRIYMNELSLYYLPSKSFKIGISIPKKLGPAVIRNKNKRQIKNIIDGYKFTKIKKQVVLIVNKKFIDKNFERKKAIIFDALKKIKNG